MNSDAFDKRWIALCAGIFGLTALLSFGMRTVTAPAPGVGNEAIELEPSTPLETACQLQQASDVIADPAFEVEYRAETAFDTAGRLKEAAAELNKSSSAAEQASSQVLLSAAQQFETMGRDLELGAVPERVPDSISDELQAPC